MVTNNKVLTVSYGTFSCTLEGFDDSFDAMKAIAEYFRDLAADDRYFGAEPPTPDAEMLTKIAEREVERRVQARHEAGAIVLSAAPEVAEANETESKAEAAQPEAVEEPTVDMAVDADAEDHTGDHDEAPEEADVDTSALVADVVAEAEDAIVEDAGEEIEQEAVVEDEAVADAAEEFFAGSEAVEADEALVEDLPIAQAEAEEDTVNLFDDAINEAAEEASQVDNAGEDDSIAAKLRRIRAVVSKAEASDDDEDDYIEDQHADVTTPIDLGDDVEEAEANAEPEAAPEPAVKPRARVIRMKREEFEEAVAAGDVEEIEDDLEDVAAQASSLSDHDEADLMAELAEVDAELAADEQVFDPEVDSAIAAPETVEVAEEESRQARAKRRERRAKLDSKEPGDEAVDRLIEEANTKLDEPEGKGRRSAIAHLRAAVAATKAEKEAGKSFEKEDNSDAYRQDLAETVRPRSEKPAKAAPPLKLVAEQRIDTAVDKKPSGIRPRRVSVEEVAAAEAEQASSNFVEFAENMGATQLPDILEAAASYLTFVEGRKKFSRPMLMRLAYQMGDDRFQREAGLRSFGQLLRDKKIEKIAGGRFVVSDAINFKPNDRAAG